jgi:septal ring factor EnvC (AmiA/AmiB activator)
MAERAPRLAALDETFNRLEELSADATQLRNKLQALMAAQKSDATTETIATLNELARRIDTRLGEVQTKVQTVREDIDALQGRLEKRKSRLLFVFNLLALLSTLMLAWILYTQVVVIRHHWVRVRSPAAKLAPGDHEPAPIARSGQY